MIEIKTEQFPLLSYRKFGNGPVIVLIHGFPEDGDLWQNIWPLLATAYTVLVPDLPGSIASTFNGEEMTMAQLADSIKVILDNEQVDKAILVGHSMGGYVALAFAAQYPGLLQGISLVHSTATADTDEKKETRRKAIEVLKKGGKEAFIKQMVPNLFSPEFMQQHPTAVQRQIEASLEVEALSMILYYQAMIARPDRTDLLRTIKVPVQWILGKEDSLIPPAAVLPQAYLADINYVSLYPHCGHMSMLESMERLSTDLKTFAGYCYNR